MYLELLVVFFMSPWLGEFVMLVQPSTWAGISTCEPCGNLGDGKNSWRENKCRLGQQESTLGPRALQIPGRLHLWYGLGEGTAGLRRLPCPFRVQEVCGECSPSVAVRMEWGRHKGESTVPVPVWATWIHWIPPSSGDLPPQSVLRLLGFFFRSKNHLPPEKSFRVFWGRWRGSSLGWWIKVPKGRRASWRLEGLPALGGDCPPFPVFTCTLLSSLSYCLLVFFTPSSSINWLS